jgi:hypothetical protein
MPCIPWGPWGPSEPWATGLAMMETLTIPKIKLTIKTITTTKVKPLGVWLLFSIFIIFIIRLILVKNIDMLYELTINNEIVEFLNPTGCTKIEITDGIKILLNFFI